MILFGRRIIVTTLDPIPRLFRAASGVLVMNARELEAFEQQDHDVFAMVVDICKAEDMAEAILQLRPHTDRRRRPLSPSTRLFMLGAVSPGRRENIMEKQS
jgi:hypothetical protein